MATKKKGKKKTSARNRKATVRTRSKSTKKNIRKKKTAPKRGGARNRVAKVSNTPKKRMSTKGQERGSTSFQENAKTQMGDADSQGLSNAARANSESVSELLEEGNTFEAGAVSGVEEADDADEREVHTHEFPEDDVPEEYLDKD